MVKRCATYVSGTIFLILLFAASASAGVSIYAEGAYTADDLKLYIYADVDTTPIVSYGLTINYPTDRLVSDPSDPGAPVVEKNKNVWYFGSPGDASYATPNADPDISVPGQIVIVGGKIDANNPTEGVGPDTSLGETEKTRILIAKITFTRKTGTDTPDTGFSFELGKPSPYANFVQNDGAELDSAVNTSLPGSLVTIYKLGDADGDGMLTSSDMFDVRDSISANIYHCYMDCDEDGMLTSSDMFCIRDRI